MAASRISKIREARARWSALGAFVLGSILIWAPRLLANPAEGSWWRPPADASKDGWRVEALFWYTTIMCVIAFALVCAALLLFPWLYRSRPGHKAFYHHGTDRKSFAVTGVLAALVFFLIDLRLVQASQKDIKEFIYEFPSSPDTVRVEVMPQQWAWNFRYPGPDNIFNTADDIITFNEFKVPVGRPVMLNLKAKDVIHSFYLPAFRIKHDANPGYVTRMWFQAKTTGTFEIACSQMCGWAHYKMRGEMTVLSDDAYKKWLVEANGDAARSFDPTDKEALWGWEWRQ